MAHRFKYLFTLTKLLYNVYNKLSKLLNLKLALLSQKELATSSTFEKKGNAKFSAAEKVFNYHTQIT